MMLLSKIFQKCCHSLCNTWENTMLIICKNSINRCQCLSPSGTTSPKISGRFRMRHSVWLALSPIPLPVYNMFMCVGRFFLSLNSWMHIHVGVYFIGNKIMIKIFKQRLHTVLLRYCVLCWTQNYLIHWSMPRYWVCYSVWSQKRNFPLDFQQDICNAPHWLIWCIKSHVDYFH